MCGFCCGGFGLCNTCRGCTGNLFLVAEKLISYCALTAVVLCIVITVAITMGIGIGLGYNYCVVDFKVQARTVKPVAVRSNTAEDFEISRRALVSPTESTKVAIPDTQASTESVAINKYVLTLPLHGNMDFLSLISKLRTRNQNATLELVT